MGVLKELQVALRQQLEYFGAAFNDEIEKPVQEEDVIHACFQQLAFHAAQLFEVDEKISKELRTSLSSEDDLFNEYVEAVEYEGMFTLYRIKYERLTEKDYRPSREAAKTALDYVRQWGMCLPEEILTVRNHQKHITEEDPDSEHDEQGEDEAASSKSSIRLVKHNHAPKEENSDFVRDEVDCGQEENPFSDLEIDLFLDIFYGQWIKGRSPQKPSDRRHVCFVAWKLEKPQRCEMYHKIKLRRRRKRKGIIRRLRKRGRWKWDAANVFLLGPEDVVTPHVINTCSRQYLITCGLQMKI